MHSSVGPSVHTFPGRPMHELAPAERLVLACPRIVEDLNIACVPKELKWVRAARHPCPLPAAAPASLLCSCPAPFAADSVGGYFAVACSFRPGRNSSGAPHAWEPHPRTLLMRLLPL